MNGQLLLLGNPGPWALTFLLLSHINHEEKGQQQIGPNYSSLPRTAVSVSASSLSLHEQTWWQEGDNSKALRSLF